MPIGKAKQFGQIEIVSMDAGVARKTYPINGKTPNRIAPEFLPIYEAVFSVIRGGGDIAIKFPIGKDAETAQSDVKRAYDATKRYVAGSGADNKPDFYVTSTATEYVLVVTSG